MAKVKGAHVITAVKVLRAHRERALALLPPALHHFLEERLLPSSWFPFDEHIALLRTVAAVLGGPAPWLMMGRGTARTDLSGIYKGYLKSGDVARTLQAMSAMWKSAHDSGEVLVAVVDDGHATVRLRGFAPRSAEICGICTGYLSESVQMAIGREPKVEHPECRARGGVECVWSVAWTG